MAVANYFARLVYDINGGSGSVPGIRIEMLTTPNTNVTFIVASSPNPTKDGHKFKGWSTNSSDTTADYVGGDEIVVKTGNQSSPTNTVTLYAVFKRTATYSAELVYKANGGSNPPPKLTYTSSTQNQDHNFTIAAYDSNSPRPVFEGHTFKGWSKSSTATTPTYSNPAQSGTDSTITVKTGNSTDDTNTQKLYAVWKAKTYTITYNPGANGSGSVQTQTKTYGVAATLKGAIFTRPGHTQDGWSKTDGGSKTYNLGASYSTNASVTLYPHWSAAATYTVTYKANGGTGSDHVQTVTYGENWTTWDGSGFSRQGYTLTGWATRSDGPKVFSLNRGQGAWDRTSNLTLYAVWSSPQQYTVTYKANGGTGSDHVQTVTYDQSWTTWDGSGFSRPGYVLLGWATSANGPKVYSLGRTQSPWTKDYNLTLYAVWEISSIVRVKTSSGIKTGVVYVKQDGQMKLGIVYVKKDGQMHQNA